MIYMTQLLQNENESDYVDEGDNEADWKKICQEEGIDITSGKGEPVEEAVEHDDAPTNKK